MGFGETISAGAPRTVFPFTDVPARFLLMAGPSPRNLPAAGLSSTRSIRSSAPMRSLHLPDRMLSRGVGQWTNRVPEGVDELDGPVMLGPAAPGAVNITNFSMNIEWWDEQTSEYSHEDEVKEIEDEIEVLRDRMKRLQVKRRAISYSIKSYKIALPLLKEDLSKSSTSTPKLENESSFSTTSSSSSSDDGECLLYCDPLSALWRAVERVKGCMRHPQEKTVTMATEQPMAVEHNHFLFSLPSLRDKKKGETSLSDVLRKTILENCGSKDQWKLLRTTIHNLEQHIIPHKEKVLDEVVEECYHLFKLLNNLEAELHSTKSLAYVERQRVYSPCGRGLQS